MHSLSRPSDECITPTVLKTMPRAGLCLGTRVPRKGVKYKLLDLTLCTYKSLGIMQLIAECTIRKHNHRRNSDSTQHTLLRTPCSGPATAPLGFLPAAESNDLQPRETTRGPARDGKLGKPTCVGASSCIGAYGDARIVWRQACRGEEGL